MSAQTQKLSVLFQQNNFAEITALINAREITFQDFYVALKKNAVKRNQIFLPVAFWRSDLPLIVLPEFCRCPLKIAFFENYFSDDRFSNTIINKELIRSDFEEFKCFFKLMKCHRRLTFMASIDEIARTHGILLFELSIRLGVFVQEMRTVAAAEIKLEEDEAYDDKLLLQIAFDKVLTGVVCYHEAMMQSDIVEGNHDQMTMYDAAIVREANRIVGTFLKSKNSLRTEFTDSNSLKQRLKEILPQSRYSDPKNIDLSAEDKIINDVLNRGITRQSYRFLIGNFLAGFASFTDPLIVESITLNEEYKRYRVNDYKSRFEELYFSDILINEKPHHAKIDSMIATIENIYTFYNIPNVVETNNGFKFDLHKAILLLFVFSEYKSPQSRLLIPQIGRYIPFNQPDKRFLKHFGANEHISIFDEDDLIECLKNYFGWEFSEIRELLSLLTVDISRDNSKNLFQNPFIKINNQIYWLGRLFKKRKWSAILRDKVCQENVFKPPKGDNRLSVGGKIAKSLEDAVRNTLSNADFDVLPKPNQKFPFKLKSGETGEIDTLAYKAGELLIVEVKSGWNIEEPNEISRIETLRLEGFAAEQLDKINNYVAESWDDDLRHKFNADISYKDLKIYSLIITDFFEGDLKVFKSAYSKISYLELEIIIKNNKKRLVENTMLFLRSVNSLNPDYKRQLEKIDWNLWEDKSEFTLEILQDCIENNRVWKDIEELKEF